MSKMSLSFNKNVRELKDDFWLVFTEAAIWVFYKKGILINFAKFTGKHLRQSLFLIKLPATLFIQKETLTQVFSCELCEIFKNTFFTEHLRVAASVSNRIWRFMHFI